MEGIGKCIGKEHVEWDFAPYIDILPVAPPKECKLWPKYLSSKTTSNTISNELSPSH